MIYPKRQLILTFAAVVLAGCALHFLYGWQPNAATALFSPEIGRASCRERV